MAYHDVLFPREVSWGSGSANRFRTLVNEVPSGAEVRAGTWSTWRRRFTPQLETLEPALLKSIVDHHVGREGRLHTFPYSNPLDYSTNPAAEPDEDSYQNLAAGFDDEPIGTGDGASTQFQLVKRYTSGAQVRTKNIVRPIAGTVRVGVDSGAGVVEQLAGWSVNYDTGVVTFSSPPANGEVVTAGCKFHVPVRYEQDDLTALLRQFDDGVVPECSMIEDVGTAVSIDDFFYGSASTQAIAADTELSPYMGHFVRFDPASSGLSVLLLDPSNFPAGGPHWFVQNISGSHSIAFKRAGATLWTLAAGARAEILLGYDSSGTALTWVAL